jgi:thiol-disulfide isomerase/thioredoxin
MHIIYLLTAAVTATTGAAALVITGMSAAEGTAVAPTENVAVVTDVRTAAEDTVDFTWINAGGIPSSLSDFRGNVVLINFWATWCIPCRKEIPDLISINTELSGNGLTIIGISVDDTEDIARVDMFIEDQEIPYINVLDDGRIAEHIGSIRAVPTTLIIDRDGTVQETIVGVRTKEQFMEKIKRYL